MAATYKRISETSEKNEDNTKNTSTSTEGTKGYDLVSVIQYAILMEDPKRFTKKYLINDSTRNEFIAKINIAIMSDCPEYFSRHTELQLFARKAFGFGVYIPLHNIMDDRSIIIIKDVKHNKPQNFSNFMAHRFFDENQKFTSISTPNRDMRKKKD